MSDSLLSDKIAFLKAFLFIKSKLDIESLGKLVSERLVGGLPLGGLQNHIRDEIPAIYIYNILGCQLILLGFPDEGYNLSLTEYDFPHYVFRRKESTPITVDMSGNLYHLLKDLEEEVRIDERYSLTDLTIFRKAHVRIESELDIESLGKLISEKLVGGLPFSVLGDNEIPTVYIDNILGCKLVLLRFPGKESYKLKLTEYDFPYYLFAQEGNTPIEVDMSGNLYHLLKDANGISVSLE